MSRDRLLVCRGPNPPQRRALARRGSSPDLRPPCRAPAVSGRVEVERTGFSVQAQRDGSTLFLSLVGEFDWAVTGHVEGALEKACELPLEHVVFDLSALTFIDITGLKVILKTHEGAPARGFDVTVVRPRGLANRIFTLTRAAETLEIVDRV